MSTNIKQKSASPAVESSIKILKYLSRRISNHCTLTQLSSALDINKSTCLRILRTMCDEDILSYNKETKTYSLGIRLIMLGSRAAEYTDYINLAQPYLNKLMQETNMTAMLLRPLDEKRVSNIATVESSNNLIQVNLRVGDWYKTTSVASGICLLAYWDESKIKETVESSNGFGSDDFPHSIQNYEDLQKAIDMVHQQGFCVTREQYSQKPLIVTVAAPIYDFSGKPVMSICVVDIYSSDSEQAQHTATCGSIIKKYSRQITSEIGGNPPYPGRY